MISLRVLCMMALLLPIAAQAETLLPGDAKRGEILHQAKCVACHDARVYTRTPRQVKTMEGLIGRVNACNQQLRAGFSRDDVNDVVKYLNDRYYQFEP